MKIIFSSSARDAKNPKPWLDAIAAALPDAEVWIWTPACVQGQADYAIVWAPPAELFATQRGLKAVFNIGAGVDGLMVLPYLPEGVPIVRLNDAGMTVQMAEYVCHALIRHTREFDVYAAQGKYQQWKMRQTINRTDFPVGVMGLGSIGARVAEAVAAFGYATSDRGACHLRATFYKPELSGLIKPEQIEGKAEMFVDFEDRLTVFDTLVLCRFYRDLYTWDRLGDMIHALTGLPAGKQDLRAVAASVSTLIRRFNIREGLVRNDDRLSPALHRSLEDSGKNITEDELAFMVREYYRLRGWDEQGIPPVDTIMKRGPK